jgi:hypothetical protein
LNPLGDTNATEELGNTARGTFSNWNMTESILRNRIKNPEGIWEWEKINTNDSEAVNINQLDIPITKGEKVEIQVASVSEAGYPSNPLVSDWSDSIIITFPEEFSTNSPAEDILRGNTADESQLQIDQTLVTRGVISHIADSFYANEQNFVHTTQSIASGFLSAEQTPISLFEKLTEMQTQIGQLLDIVGNAMGEMVVTITDESGNVYNVDENGLLKIYAGSYSDEVSKLSVKKGAIITKNFMLNIHNVADTGLRLQSKYYGSRTIMVDESDEWSSVRGYMPNRRFGMTNSQYRTIESTSTYNVKDNDYNTYYKYDRVPLNLYANEDIIAGVNNGTNFQSAQCKNQFLNLRYRNISDNISLYGETADDVSTVFDSHEIQFAKMDAESSAEHIIFNGFSDSDSSQFDFVSAQDFVDNDYKFAVHSSHPYLSGDNPAATLKGVIAERLNISEDIVASMDSAHLNQALKYLFMISRNDEIEVMNLKSIPNIDMASMVMQTAQATPAMMSATASLNPGSATPSSSPSSSASASTASASTITASQNVVANNLAKRMDYTIFQQAPYEYVISDFAVDDNNSIKMPRTHKLGYDDDDRYLLGKDSCTSYLFMNTAIRDDIQVEGDARNSSKVVTGGAVISIPFTFQYRMTDYWGEGETGTGRILGDSTISVSNRLNISNIRFANRLGFDIWLGKDKPFSFDIEVYANYGETSSNINPASLVQFNSATMTTAINKSTARKNSKESIGMNNEISAVKPQQTKNNK